MDERTKPQTKQSKHNKLSHKKLEKKNKCLFSLTVFQRLKLQYESYFICFESQATCKYLNVPYLINISELLSNNTELMKVNIKCFYLNLKKCRKRRKNAELTFEYITISSLNYLHPPFS